MALSMKRPTLLTKTLSWYAWIISSQPIQLSTRGHSATFHSAKRLWERLTMSSDADKFLSLLGFAQNQPVELTAPVSIPFRFAFLGDTRFTNPADTRDSNATVRRTLVEAIANACPRFVSVGGDIVYHGNDANDWKTWDVETAIWHEHGISVYPVLGNMTRAGVKLRLRTISIAFLN
jgi:hypothetical protein